MRKILVLAATILFAACGGKDRTIDVGTGPSAVTAPAPAATTSQLTNLQNNCVITLQRYSADKLTLNIYGNLNKCLDKPTDPTGAMIYARFYDSAGKRTSWTVPYANSTPIGNSNDTVVRDIPAQDVDLNLQLQPRGCTSQSCWVQFSFSSMDQVILIPDGNYHREVSGSEVRLRGKMPKIE